MHLPRHGSTLRPKCRPLGWGFYLCMAAGTILFLACIVLVTTGFTFLFLYVPMIDWAILGVLFVFVVLPLLLVAVAVKFSEKRKLDRDAAD